jgi:hypothetical protein
VSSIWHPAARESGQTAGEGSRHTGEGESPEEARPPEGESQPVLEALDTIGEVEGSASEPVSDEATSPDLPQAETAEDGGPQAAVPGQDEAGPLAGLTGLLSADQGVPRLPGQATRPLHLKITANQRLHADLLHSLVEMEGQPRRFLRPGLTSA